MVISAKKQILIVDDAQDIVTLLTDLLTGEGYKTSSASNGLEALRFLRTTSELPGLILLDLMMPDMDGYQFRHEQEKEHNIAYIPIVIMTADGNVQSKSLKIGAKAFLKKPFSDIDIILRTVENFLK